MHIFLATRKLSQNIEKPLVGDVFVKSQRQIANETVISNKILLHKRFQMEFTSWVLEPEFYENVC